MTGHPHQWFGGRTYAQHGDDLAVLNIFHRLGIAKPSYLDVGAYHPFDLSNTALLYERGSRGINVEPNEAHHALFLKARPDDINLCVGVAPMNGRLAFHHVAADPGRFTFDVATATTLGIVKSVEAPVLTLNEIVAHHAGGAWPDLLSIDIEGLDIDVLRSAEFGGGPPRVVVVEADNGSGSNAAELGALMAVKGFTLHSWCGSNMIFVRAADQALVWGD
ncbi:FkbM family methyltransferase [Mesorhizobium sp. WSM4962]|uniref:FkbM family methyltransferase n=1 Tax=Mesorhizobium sp. WSM4962 TaxID=3038548 RepID=UPI0024159F54|nr:FkbM family methyltransferase [Mesorhizobium sp. WSM4962]MDG4903204.1 FkbM family methyltransferase [Mesorhizobium sp. WSM4962]